MAKKTSKSRDIPVNQTHGALTPQNPTQLLNSILGRNRGGPFSKFTSLDEYSNKLNSMTLGELHAHAVEDVEILPISDRERLIDRLEKEYAVAAQKNAGLPRGQTLSPERAATAKEIMDKLRRI